MRHTHGDDDGVAQAHGHGHAHAHGHGATRDVPFHAASPQNAGRGLRAIVYDVLPTGATPTGTLTQPVHRHVLDNAGEEVVALTAERMSQELGDSPHVIVAVTEQDLDPATDGDVLGVLAQTGGGVVVFGVSYDVDASSDTPTAGTREDRPVAGESCPECGSADAFEISRSADLDPRGMRAVLVECRECGAVWDADAVG